MFARLDCARCTAAMMCASAVASPVAVTRITSHDGTFTTFGYDKAGRRTKVTDPLGRTTSYAYDVYGRLKVVVDPANGATQYGYDVMGNLTSLTVPRPASRGARLRPSPPSRRTVPRA